MASNDPGVLVPHEDVVGEDEGPSGSRAGPQGPDAAAGEEQTSAPSAFDTDMANIDIIRASEQHKPYVGSKEPLSALKEEYASGSPVFRRKIEALEHLYSEIRRTRGDGNCFFRSFIFAYLERLVVRQDLQEILRFASCIQGWKQKLLDAGFQELVFEDAMDLLQDQINAIGAAGSKAMSLEALESNFRDDTVSNMVVMFLRMVTSAEIQRRQDFFLPFILGMQDDASMAVESFCRRFVEPMGEESDHIQAVALSDAFGVPIRVVYLDSTGGSDGSDARVNSHDFIPDGTSAQGGGAGGDGLGGSEGTAAAAASKTVQVHVLYRPGHYDVLYPLVPTQ